MEHLNKAISESASRDDVLAQYLILRINEQYYGLSIANVVEIVAIQPATQLPGLPCYVKGIINLRGHIVPLIDMNVRFGNPEREYTERTCIIIMDFSGMYMGLIVDAVEDVQNIEENMISSPPSISAGDSASFVIGIGKLEKYLVLLLDGYLLFADTNISMPANKQVL